MSGENSGSNSWRPGSRRPPLPARHFRTDQMWPSSDRLTEVRHFRRLQALLPSSQEGMWQPLTRQPLPLLNLTPPQERQVERLLALRRHTDGEATPSGDADAKPLGFRVAQGGAIESLSERHQALLTRYLPSLTQILWWLERYGTWCWLGVWLTGIVAGGLAAWLLWDPDFSKAVDLSPTQSSELADVVNSGDAESMNTKTLSSPLTGGDGQSSEWLFAGVALSCAAGAFLMSRWLDEQD